MYTLDLILRFAAVSQLVLIVVILVKEHRDKLSGVLAALFALSVACYLVGTPVLRYWHWGVWSYPFLVGAKASPVLFWLLAKSLFEDSFRFRWYYVFILLVVELLDFGMGLHRDVGGIVSAAADRQAGDLVGALVPRLLVFAFVFLGLFAAMKDWRADLVESRRRFRFALLVTTGGYMVVIASGTLILAGAGMPPPIIIQALNAAAIFVMTFIFNLRLLSLQAGFLATAVAKGRSADVPSVTSSKAIEDLQRLMKEERVFSEEALTIRKLADKLGQQEYRLRRLINIHLGYRNFNDFLNHYRIAEATERLTDPKSRHLPVLTIAMDAGYRSLAPFNKAFKQIHGLTPTEYRKSKVSAAPEAQSPDIT